MNEDIKERLEKNDVLKRKKWRRTVKLSSDVKRKEDKLNTRKNNKA